MVKRKKYFEPKEALVRGGHKHPEQILSDLEKAGCLVLNRDEVRLYETILGRQ